MTVIPDKMQQQDLCYTNNNEYKTNGGNMLQSLLAVKGNTRDHIDYAISRYQSQIRWACDIAVSRCRMTSCKNARKHAVSSTMQNDDNYLKDAHFMPPEMPWIDDHSATEHRHTAQHTRSVFNVNRYPDIKSAKRPVECAMLSAADVWHVTP